MYGGPEKRVSRLQFLSELPSLLETYGKQEVLTTVRQSIKHIQEELAVLSSDMGRLKKEKGERSPDIAWLFDVFLSMREDEVRGIQKQLKHWLHLLKLLTTHKRRSSLASVTEEEIQEARLYPYDLLLNRPGKKNGKTIAFVCPLHTEKTASFTVYLDNNRWYCFGCSERGDVIDLYRKLNPGISFPEAVKFLTNKPC